MVESFIKCSYSSPGIIRIFRSGITMWAQCAAYMGEMGSENLFEGKPERKRLLGLGVQEKIILNRVLME